MSIDSVTPFIEPLSTVIGKFLEAEISVHKSILINHKEKQIEYDIQIILTNEASKREGLAAKIQSYFKEPFKMEGVLSFNALLVPTHYDLVEKNITSLNQGKFQFDIGRLIREVKFDIASLKIIARMPDNVLEQLVIPTKSSSGIHEGNKIKARLEVSLDYGSAWYKKYDRFEVRDIEYFHTISISPATIGEVIPREFYNKMMAAARAYPVSNKKVNEFFSILSKNFLLFESEQYYGKVFNTVTVDSDSFEVVDVTPKMQQREVIAGGPQVLLPGSYRIRFRTRIEGNEIVKRTHAYIDIDKLKAIFSEMIALTNLQTKHLTF